MRTVVVQTNVWQDSKFWQDSKLEFGSAQSSKLTFGRSAKLKPADD